jgi:hypothetical protein
MARKKYQCLKLPNNPTSKWTFTVLKLLPLPIFVAVLRLLPKFGKLPMHAGISVPATLKSNSIKPKKDISMNTQLVKFADLIRNASRAHQAFGRH